VGAEAEAEAGEQLNVGANEAGKEEAEEAEDEDVVFFLTWNSVVARLRAQTSVIPIAIS
jgi:hypothetical protein